MDKKFKSVLLLSFLLMLLCLPVVEACKTNYNCQKEFGPGYRCIGATWKRSGTCVKVGGEAKEVNPALIFMGSMGSGLKKIGEWAFQHPLDRVGLEELRWIALYAIVFFMLGFAFYDIITMLGVWQFPGTPKMLGFGLAAIVGLSGLMGKLIITIFSAIALYGAVSVGFSLFVVFSAWFLLHITIFKKLGEFTKGRMEAAQEAAAKGQIAKAGAGLRLAAGITDELGKTEKGFKTFFTGKLYWLLGILVILFFVIAYFIGA